MLSSPVGAETDGSVHVIPGALAWVIASLEKSVLRELWILEHVCEVAYGHAGDPGRPEALYPFSRRGRRRDFSEALIQLMLPKKLFSRRFEVFPFQEIEIVNHGEYHFPAFDCVRHNADGWRSGSS